MNVIDMSARFARVPPESAEDDEAFFREYRRTRAIDAAIERLIGRLARKGYSADEIIDRFQGTANALVEIRNDPEITMLCAAHDQTS
jgi:hypothetical protein